VIPFSTLSARSDNTQQDIDTWRRSAALYTGWPKKVSHYQMIKKSY